MFRQQICKSQQHGWIGATQCAGDTAQFCMFSQRALNQVTFSGMRQKHQKVLLLDTEVRIEFGREETDDALCQIPQFARLARFRGTSGVTRELERGVMLTGKR